MYVGFDQYFVPVLSSHEPLDYFCTTSVHNISCCCSHINSHMVTGQALQKTNKRKERKEESRKRKKKTKKKKKEKEKTRKAKKKQDKKRKQGKETRNKMSY